MENEKLKHLEGKSCPVILSIRQCRDASFGSRPAEGKKKDGMGGEV